AFDESDRNRLMHQVLHEEPPRPRSLNPEVPRDLETIVLKAIDKDPARRYQTAADLADDLRRFVEDRPIRARRGSRRERRWRWCRRNPALAAATGLATAALLAITVLSILYAGWQAHSRTELTRAYDELAATLNQSRRQSARLALERGQSLIAQKDR